MEKMWFYIVLIWNICDMILLSLRTLWIQKTWNVRTSSELELIEI